MASSLSEVQVFLYDLSLGDDRDPLERVLFKHPVTLAEDEVRVLGDQPMTACRWSRCAAP